MKQLALLCLLAIGIGGCASTYRVSVGHPDYPQPWVAPSERAEAKVEITYFGTWDQTTSTSAAWIGSNGKRWAMEDVVQRLRRQLNTWGYEQPGSVHAGPSPEEPWGTGLENDSRDGVRIGTTLVTVVCLDPVVALRTSGKVFVCRDLKGAGASGTIASTHWDRVILPHGFSYGDTARYSRNTLWFSPTLTDDLMPVEFIDADEARIPVPWGHLRLVREGERWIVHAEGKTVE